MSAAHFSTKGSSREEKMFSGRGSFMQVLPPPRLPWHISHALGFSVPNIFFNLQILVHTGWRLGGCLCLCHFYLPVTEPESHNNRSETQ